MSSSEQKPRESLNPYQANRLRITCQYIDKLLAEIEEILNSANSKSPFPRYATDVLPAQRRTIDDYVARIRAQLVRILEGQGIAREKPSIPMSRAVHVHLGAIDIAVEELEPKYMRGYGDVPQNAATELKGIVAELSGLVHHFDRYLSEGVGEDLHARLERLSQAGNNLELLKKIEETVRSHGLVEFRSSIAAILDRAEDRSFEIAVFGRVSAGKSSLLNAILGTDALPVGVTPITAVPTRIVYADQPSLAVWFSESPRKTFEISHLAEFATEQQNPANAKHVVRLVLALPSPRLRGGVAFVDTPGLGSLASSGAAETLAYLPKCDLGVVLIDAGSTLTADDLQTILTLAQAAIPVNVLLSKADLVRPEDRSRIIRYVKEHVASECKLDLPVHAVSILPSCSEMLQGWFETQIVPLYARSQELRAASLRRKIGALRDSVAAALEARLRQANRSSSNATKERAQAAEALLRKTTGAIEDMSAACARYTDAAAGGLSDAITEAARRFLHARSHGSYGVVVPGQMARDSITQFVQMQVQKLQKDIIGLADQLSASLRQCAADLDVPDAPVDDEFRSLMRGAPVFDPPSFTMAASPRTFAQLLGQRAAERSVASQIARRLPPTFRDALEAYWQLVKAWCESVLGQLKHRFETYAESYRAQAEQALGENQLTSDALGEIARSLAQIKASSHAPDEPDNDSGQRIPARQEEAV